MLSVSLNKTFPFFLNFCFWFTACLFHLYVTLTSPLNFYLDLWFNMLLSISDVEGMGKRLDTVIEVNNKNRLQYGE